MKYLASLLVVAALSVAPAQTTSNVVFYHPDGMALQHWNAARMYWYGPDQLSPWDRLPYMAVYRGHMGDRLAGTSNGGATTHAFGYKVDGRGSFGKDGDGEATPPTDRFIRALSGFPGSVLREASAKGHPIGVVNDGHIGEPGTGAFLAEVGNRDNWDEITLQILNGRPGQNDRRPAVIFGGGEEDMLPEGTTGVHGPGTRKDGVNLIARAQADGWIVLRTRGELLALEQRMVREPSFAPKVLGVFARFHLFNDRNEERLIADGFVNPTIPVEDKRTNLILFGPRDPAAPGFQPPTTAEMTRVALVVLERQARAARKPFALVVETESCDNFGNANNAIGVLTAARHANLAIQAMEQFRARVPNTLVLTAADSDASGLQVLPQEMGRNVGASSSNAAEGAAVVNNPLDGRYGRGTAAFVSEPDQFGVRFGFGIGWVGGPDYAGGIISRAAGPGAALLQTHFGGRFDNIDCYRLMHRALFGRLLPYPQGKAAPAR